MKVEYVILADSAQVTDGKLYLMGGGFTVYRSPVFPVAEWPIAIATSVLVEPRECGRRYDLSMRYLTDAGVDVIKPYAIGLTLGAALIPEAQSRAIVAISARLPIPAPGSYTIVVTVGDQSTSTSFHAVPASTQVELPPLSVPSPAPQQPAMPRRRRRRKR